MPSAARRGRPLKFGRPARTLAVTLPEDVIDALQARDADVGRAIVALVQERTPATIQRARRTVSVARAGRRQRLIIVDPSVLPGLPGCRLMRIGADQAFITLDPGAGLADLELAVLDRLAEPRLSAREREALQALRSDLRRWRKDDRVTVYPRAIVVLEGAAS